MTRIGKTLLAGAVVAGLGALAGVQPAKAAIVTYDMVFTAADGVTASGSITLDTSLLSGNTTCAFGGGCGFTGFATTFDLGAPSFTFGPGDAGFLELTVVGGIPVSLDLASETVASNEDGNDFAGTFMSSEGWTLGGVIDGFEFNIDGTYAFVVPGGGDPDPVGVPEPTTLMLFGAGLAGAALMRRKRVSAA